jgi:hypothetical protein
MQNKKDLYTFFLEKTNPQVFSPSLPITIRLYSYFFYIEEYAPFYEFIETWLKKRFNFLEVLPAIPVDEFCRIEEPLPPKTDIALLLMVDNVFNSRQSNLDQFTNRVQTVRSIASKSLIIALTPSQQKNKLLYEQNIPNITVAECNCFYDEFFRKEELLNPVLESIHQFIVQFKEDFEQSNGAGLALK